MAATQDQQPLLRRGKVSSAPMRTLIAVLSLPALAAPAVSHTAGPPTYARPAQAQAGRSGSTNTRRPHLSGAPPRRWRANGG